MMTVTDRKIFCAASKYSYNDPRRGLAYEFVTVFKSLQDAFPSACFVDVYQPGGIDELKSRLSTTSGARPIVLYIPFTGTITPENAREIRRSAELGIFHLDDTWRIDTVKKYAHLCDWFTTSDPQYHWRYRGFTGSQVRHLPFGYDEISSAAYCKPFDQRDINISFVGARNEYRDHFVSRLKRFGINVDCFGAGWNTGAVPQEDFFKIVGRSRFSLNLSNSSQWDARFLVRYPIALLRNLRSKKTIEQLKARHLEISALGACQITFYSSGLEKIFKIGEDIMLYPNVEELAYILTNMTDDEARTVAENGRQAVSKLGYQTAFRRLFG